MLCSLKEINEKNVKQPCRFQMQSVWKEGRKCFGHQSRSSPAIHGEAHDGADCPPEVQGLSQSKRPAASCEDLYVTAAAYAMKEATVCGQQMYGLYDTMILHCPVDPDMAPCKSNPLEDCASWKGPTLE